MSESFNASVAQLRAALDASPGTDGLLAGYVALLETAPDSALIVDGLAGIDPDAYSDDELRTKVAGLLRDAGALEMAGAWDPVMAHLSSGGAPRPLPPVSGGRAKAKGPVIGFDDIGGLEDVKTQVRRRIINPFLKQELFARFKRKSGGGVLMYGPPGCGKTMMARALAHECNAHFLNVKAADLLDRYIGGTENRIVEIFDEARRRAPTVLFFDEVEAIAQKRQHDSHARVNTGVSALLTEMDGFDGQNEAVLLLGATNVPWSLDGAFRRPGRFGRTLFVPPPDKVARRFILNRALVGRPVADGLDLSDVVARTSGFSGADLIDVVDTALDYAIEESDAAGDLVPLNAEHFKEGLAEVRPSTGEWFSQANAYATHANRDGLYDDLAAFLKKHRK
ncbi:ATP-binding protein [uncultured Algimonas sp.]|uniref:ATP-binding protein n=1 Tax=uncultured Algimonas sp. TaxID=1547920 RepID=UPI00263625D0|nr:ATP-binding protein [uncultured Algimonas sp.]